MTDRLDEALRAMLAPPDEFPDAIFTARVRNVMLAEQRMNAARKASWRLFAIELFASGAVVIAFVLLARITPAAGSLEPGLIGFLLLALWVTAALRPAAAGRQGPAKKKYSSRRAQMPEGL